LIFNIASQISNLLPADHQKYHLFFGLSNF
jgi:hypothetical protein